MLQKKSGVPLVPLALGWVMIGVHFFIFSQFFPNAQGKLGHDYRYNLPLLLDGYYWFLNNGVLSVPWFTPSFCGGMPLLANPATFYVSVMQFFTFLVDPLTSIRLSLLLFAALGFWGFYLLLSRIFKTGRWTALLGGTIFLFNGLYAYRFVVGHMEFHSFMLTPLVAFLLLTAEPSTNPLWRWHRARNIICSSLLISYAFMSGMTQLIVPSLIAAMVVALLAKLAFGDQLDLRGALLRLLLAGAGALGLSAAKLVAAMSFLANFPRDSYLLPGVDSVGKLLGLVLEALAIGGIGIDGATRIVNFQWSLDRHEFEFGLTLVPFLLIIVGVILNFRHWRQAVATIFSARQVPYLALGALLLAIPLLLNYYSPAWNHFLKTVPFIKNLSNFFRWFIIYIPCIIVLAALAVEKTTALQRCRPYVALAGIFLIVAQNLMTDKEFYHAEPYDPAVIVEAYRQTRGNGRPPVIRNQVASQNEFGESVFILPSNDALAGGDCQLLCYEPMFGFRLEFLPFKTIHPGPTLSESEGLLNLKNPACYLYPEENHCTPGDHFREDQHAAAERFISFHPFPYEESRLQKAANWLNIFSLLALPVWAMAYGLAGWQVRRRWDKV